MKSSAKKVELASVDDLFSTEESRADAQREKVVEIPLSELHPFKGHPFKVKDDEAMMETADSIKQYGVLVPAIARPDPEGGYELVAGHRRHRASELAEKETMPVIVRDLDDDAATIIMVDSNLQRESLLPSERAFAYKMKLDAMKRQAGRPSKENVSQVGTQKRSDQLLAEQVGQSRNQIQRYIRLTELIPELMNMVDEKKIALNPAYLLLYGYDVTGKSYQMRLVGMALGAALTCFVFYRNHKNRTYKRNLKDLIQEFDITSSRTKWQICQILCVPIVLCIAELCNMPRAMWAGIAAMSVILPSMEDMHYRVRKRIVGNIAGVICFTVLYFLLPSSIYAYIGILGGIGVGFSAQYGWQAVFNTFGALAIAAETYGLQGAVSLRVSQNVFGVVFALAFCVIFYWFMPKKKESEVTVHAE